MEESKKKRNEVEEEMKRVRQRRKSVEVEELRMQLWVVTASRPVVGAQLQAVASSPGEAAERRQLLLAAPNRDVKQSAAAALDVCIHRTGSTFTCSTHARC